MEILFDDHLGLWLGDRTEGFPYRGNKTRLTRLNLGQTSVGDDGLALIARLPMLEEIALSSTPITEAGLEALRGHPKLRVIRLGWTKVGEKALAHLATIPNLEGIETFDCPNLPPEKRGRLDRAQL